MSKKKEILITYSYVILEIRITAKDEILMYEYRFDYSENDFEPLNDKIQLFHLEFSHKYSNRQVFLIVLLIERDFVQK